MATIDKNRCRETADPNVRALCYYQATLGRLRPESVWNFPNRGQLLAANFWEATLARPAILRAMPDTKRIISILRAVRSEGLSPEFERFLGEQLERSKIEIGGGGPVYTILSRAYLLGGPDFERAKEAYFEVRHNFDDYYQQKNTAEKYFESNPAVTIMNPHDQYIFKNSWEDFMESHLAVIAREEFGDSFLRGRSDAAQMAARAIDTALFENRPGSDDELAEEILTKVVEEGERERFEFALRNIMAAHGRPAGPWGAVYTVIDGEHSGLHWRRSMDIYFGDGYRGDGTFGEQMVEGIIGPLEMIAETIYEGGAPALMTIGALTSLGSMAMIYPPSGLVILSFFTGFGLGTGGYHTAEAIIAKDDPLKREEATIHAVEGFAIAAPLAVPAAALAAARGARAAGRVIAAAGRAAAGRAAKMLPRTGRGRPGVLPEQPDAPTEYWDLELDALARELSSALEAKAASPPDRAGDIPTRQITLPDTSRPARRPAAGARKPTRFDRVRTNGRPPRLEETKKLAIRRRREGEAEVTEIIMAEPAEMERTPSLVMRVALDDAGQRVLTVENRTPSAIIGRRVRTSRTIRPAEFGEPAPIEPPEPAGPQALRPGPAREAAPVVPEEPSHRPLDMANARRKKILFEAVQKFKDGLTAQMKSLRIEESARDAAARAADAAWKEISTKKETWDLTSQEGIEAAANEVLTGFKGESGWGLLNQKDVSGRGPLDPLNMSLDDSIVNATFSLLEDLAEIHWLPAFPRKAPAGSRHL